MSGWWAYYIWDMNRKQLNVVDHVLPRSPFDEQNRHHEEAMELLHEGSFTCMLSQFDAWDVSSSEWNAKFYSTLRLPSVRYYRSTSIYYMYCSSQMGRLTILECLHAGLN
jgi:hypothetical protein